MKATPDLRTLVRSSDFRSSQVGNSKGSTQMSCTKVLEPRGFKAFFKYRFSQFLQANYRNPEEVAVVYGVRYQTALNWWQGVNAPSGDTATLACLRHGDKFTSFMGQGE